jgi:transcription elongation factor GreA
MNKKVPKQIQFTKEGFEKVKAEHKSLSDGRPAIVSRLQKAREMGDLSENAAYTAARLELGDTDRRLRRLNYLIRFGVVSEEKHKGKINFGSRVTLENGNQQMTFKLVNKFESDPLKKKLSTNSPFGKAVMGKKVGDKVEVSAPAGITTYKVIKVE